MIIQTLNIQREVKQMNKDDRQMNKRIRLEVTISEYTWSDNRPEVKSQTRP